MLLRGLRIVHVERLAGFTKSSISGMMGEILGDREEDRKEGKD